MLKKQRFQKGRWRCCSGLEVTSLQSSHFYLRGTGAPEGPHFPQRQEACGAGERRARQASQTRLQEGWGLGDGEGKVSARSFRRTLRRSSQ